MTVARRNAIVTGSAGGLGRALAVRLARDGWRVALADLRDEPNRATAAAVDAIGGEARCETLDVTDPAQWRTLHDRLRIDWPHLDLLVNNAGIASAGRLGQLSLDDWRRTLDVNLNGVIYGCHTFVDWLKLNPAGAHVVNVASFAGFTAFPEMAAYNVAKAGVLALSETMRAELTKHRIGVTAVCPGFFASGLADAARTHSDYQREFIERSMKLAQVTAEEIAERTVRAVAADKMYVILPGRAYRFWLLKRFFPNRYLRKLAEKYVRKPPKSV